MKLKIIIISLIILVNLLIFFIFTKITTNKVNKIHSFPKRTIALTLPALYQITKEIIKDKFEIVLILPAGADVHNFEISFNELEKIKKAQAIFVVGLGIDDWLIRALKDYPLKIINLSGNVKFISTYKGLDPHFWLSIENMKIVAKEIEIQMEILDPVNKNFYRQNLTNVLTNLDSLAQESQQRLKGISQRNIIVQHDAFNYFAKENNLRIIGYLESNNEEISPQQLKTLIKKIENFKIKQIFKVPGEESNLLTNLAKELNLKVYELDPIEGKKTLNYFEAYLNNLKILEDALK
jgi:zinc transport system substrate-binding protein